MRPKRTLSIRIIWFSAFLLIGVILVFATSLMITTKQRVDPKELQLIDPNDLHYFPPGQDESG